MVTGKLVTMATCYLGEQEERHVVVVVPTGVRERRVGS